ncbi:sensor histidine kinase [Nannocystis pusilla]|uniref:sensor histidine kinase n=1 Tax=Nannocystis pusilla TaxID=889268 RepID=UPI003B775CBB
MRRLPAARGARAGHAGRRGPRARPRRLARRRPRRGAHRLHRPRADRPGPAVRPRQRPQVLPRGGVIEVTARRRGPRVEVVVRDQGPGIADTDRPHVFEQFYTADPARRRGGSGLGLAIARRIVDAHGGTIHVGASASRGAALVITLPLAAPIAM